MYTTNSVIDKNAKPYNADKIQELVAQFQRDGYLFLKGVLTEKEVLTLREAFVLNVLFPLSRADAIEYGVTEVVPGSHYAGRRPDKTETPEFDGQGPVSMIADPGDLCMFHNQVWHRGSQNKSDQVRYVGSVVYSQRIIAQRLYPFIDYLMPEYVWTGTDPRMQRLLGRHEKGAYG